MKHIILINIFLRKEKGLITRTEIMQEMNISDSYTRKIIKELNEDGKEHGFKIANIRGRGYLLDVFDEDSFDNYRKKHNLEIYVYNKANRIEKILFDILQESGYFTYDSIANRLMFSRTTIYRDFKQIKDILSKYNISIESKPHYGLKIIGTEKDYRRAFSKYVLHSKLFLEPTKHFYKFTNKFDKDKLRDAIHQINIKNGLIMTDVAFENILDHIMILIYRVKTDNIISESESNPVTEAKYYNFAKDSALYLFKEYHINIPYPEIKILANQVSGKAIASDSNDENSRKIKLLILNISSQIDSEYLTQLALDPELQSSLFLHIYPMLNRLYNKFELENPIIDDIYKKYTNVFLLSIRFSELLKQSYNFDLSRDEIGYLSLHIAAHMERIKNKKTENIKKICVINSNRGGSYQFLKLKLENIFPSAKIMLLTDYNLDNLKGTNSDLILTTSSIVRNNADVPIVEVSQWLDEKDVANIRRELDRYSNSKKVSLKEIMQEDFFYKINSTDYIKVLTNLFQIL